MPSSRAGVQSGSSKEGSSSSSSAVPLNQVGTPVFPDSRKFSNNLEKVVSKTVSLFCGWGFLTLIFFVRVFVNLFWFFKKKKAYDISDGSGQCQGLLCNLPLSRVVLTLSPTRDWYTCCIPVVTFKENISMA